MKCPVCSGNKLEPMEVNKSGNLLKCLKCSAQFISPDFTNKIKHVYQKNYFTSRGQGVLGYINYQSMHHQLKTEAIKKINFIVSFLNGKSLLDVGAGTGEFSEVAKKNGFKVTGNDISAYACSVLNKNKITFIKGSVTEIKLPKEAYDIVTAWDVLEHINNPTLAIKNIYQSLKIGGYLFITTPDTSSIDAKIMGHYWYGYKKIPEHVIFLNRLSITKLLSDQGFKVLSVKPWGFIRSIGFLMDRLSTFIPLFKPINYLLKKSRISKISLYLPLTDCMVVAQKD